VPYLPALAGRVPCSHVDDSYQRLYLQTGDLPLVEGCTWSSLLELNQHFRSVALEVRDDMSGGLSLGDSFSLTPHDPLLVSAPREMQSRGPTRTAEGATQLNRDTVQALRGLLKERQQRNDISPAQSVQITTLNAPTKGALTSNASHVGSILAFLLCLLGAVAITHLLENLRTRRMTEELIELDPWDDAPSGDDHLAAKRGSSGPRVAA